MSERPKNPAEQQISQEEDAEAKWLAEMLASYESKNQPPTELRESGPEILELEALFDSFDATPPIAELLLITDLTPEEADNHPTRYPAKMALIPVLEKLHNLRDKTNISSEKYQELHEKYERFSQAIGIINNNQVDHSRK